VRDDDSVARLGGDEFVVMLEDLSTQQAAAAVRAEVVAEKIRRAIDQPYAIAGQTHRSTSSIGIALFYGHAGTVDEMLKRADAALYRAKAAGRNTVRFFDTPGAG
jgi:diguanylate cyclase (GGDEF)-like protein